MNSSESNKSCVVAFPSAFPVLLLMSNIAAVGGDEKNTNKFHFRDIIVEKFANEFAQALHKCVQGSALGAAGRVRRRRLLKEGAAVMRTHSRAVAVRPSVRPTDRAMPRPPWDKRMYEDEAA
ncbi:hypothetical protein RB195_008975 [Necator americanus]|uniref:Uncharacterized protein n=1 Tax=Necator americanus TaxID=51031 RepID=A0ABR1CR76_NECAM